MSASDVQHLSERVESHDKRHSVAIAQLQDRVRAIELWQAKAAGVVLVMSLIGSMVGPMLVRWMVGGR